ncbi:hypothetical protein GIB67_008807 [Kingdonia uniflora]|uniref:Uncharacterized protein n=1 Tax=Kingdonia uniflora TaxID=39325 RepID=A0A7J7LYD0_9MAGN|nr:hypothetical protein GIB67_008807 [Kingdonia uniflora]
MVGSVAIGICNGGKLLEELPEEFDPKSLMRTMRSRVIERQIWRVFWRGYRKSLMERTNHHLGTTVKGAVDDLDLVIKTLEETGFAHDRFYIHVMGLYLDS